MLSYQHAFHAGNPADLHKHFVLAGLLSQLTRKPRPISYMETHAGRGLYDLSAPEAQKTGEAALGIARVTLPDGPYAQALATTRAQHGENTYPGSPLIAQTLLRDADQLHLMELHPAEHAALRRNLMGANTHIHHRSGPEGVLALSPPKPRRGLVLVDPSYEVKTEYESTAAFARALVAKWPEALVLIWYPLLPDNRHQPLIKGTQMLRPLRHEVAFDQKDGRGMMGSGLLLLNPPHGIGQVFDAVVPACTGVLRSAA
ncbi:23S rRNA (adenine(2030)-N(6))-methyltransferase RlmJ [Abyssibius alkaniclasticus]|uniref:23S rRNA (adenine(2030)-N(6))-methyltransferase RlmJ n=1 Tax=Abyssibius alkaniclasticus TaxID=2881234 RepID=UPI002363956B|nr:23S rRNA (adenine(2030)-N(6))-methyltransferase RlmJ [Abyssibius alkaniclasticus]UPH71491.1 23S rRNA (adenine(2030)-N(6))-methyltransferase RlmJ [Abyssibius alkaniclasticus]